MGSFSFALTTSTEDGGEAVVETTEGVFDPDTGNGSAVTTTSMGTTTMLLVDKTVYMSVAEGIPVGSELDQLAEGSCFARTWHAMAADEVRSGVLIDINHPTGLDIERLQTMVDTSAAGVRSLPTNGDSGEPGSYSVTLTDEDQDEYRRLLEMVVGVDDEGRIVSVEWTVSLDSGGGSVAGDSADRTSTERRSLTLTEFGTQVVVEAPDADDTCSAEEQEVEWACGFAAAEVMRDAMFEIYNEDPEALREIVDSFREASGDTCPEALDVPALVSSGRCKPDMVRFLFEDLGLDPNQRSRFSHGYTALFDVTYFDPEDDPEFSDACTPEQDLETVRVLLEAGADPCIGPEVEHEYDPALGRPEWDPPALGISEWDEAPEIVALVEGAAVNCTP